MSRPTVLKQVELPAGSTPIAAVARLRLIAALSGEAFGYAGTANVDVGGVWTVRADITGLIAFTNVRPNSGASSDVITSPANTVYELSTTFADRRSVTEHISVPDAAGPLYVQDILTNAPTSLPNGFMTRYAGTIGDGISTTLTVTHSLGTTDVETQVRDATSGARVDCDITNTDANTVTVGPFLTAPASNSLKVVVIG
jgi:hypothetical protein